MANEITITHSLRLVNGQYRHEFSPGAVVVSQTGNKFMDAVVNVGTTEETLSFGDLSTVGIIEIVNLDATNYVELGFSTGVYGDKLSAAKYIPHRYERNGSATFYVKANTAACNIRVIAYEA